MMADVFVLSEQYILAILESGKHSLNSGLRWSAKAIGILWLTRVTATLTSALLACKKKFTKNLHLR
jgi:hypothetical protein